MKLASPIKKDYENGCKLLWLKKLHCQWSLFPLMAAMLEIVFASSCFNTSSTHHISWIRAPHIFVCIIGSIRLFRQCHKKAEILSRWGLPACHCICNTSIRQLVRVGMKTDAQKGIWKIRAIDHLIASALLRIVGVSVWPQEFYPP